jgi:hypothetical protein
MYVLKLTMELLPCIGVFLKLKIHRMWRMFRDGLDNILEYGPPNK